MEIEVLIPHWNQAGRLRETLSSLQRQTVRAPVCVIDNASTDETPAVLAAFPETRVVRLERNLGFGAALNRGVAGSRAELVVFLNNDAVADRRFLEEIVEAQTRTGAEMIAACLRMPGGRIESAGLVVDQSLIAYDLLYGEPYANPRPAIEPFCPIGGAAAFVRGAFDEVGGFDEGFFAYFEDLDLGLRMRMAGMRCAAVPRAFAWHHHSATLGRRSHAKNQAVARSRGYLLRKYRKELSWDQKLRGGLIDAAVYAGQAVIDRNLGSLRGRLEATRLDAEPSGSAEGLDALPLADMPVREALRRRFARRRVVAGGSPMERSPVGSPPDP